MKNVKRQRLRLEINALAKVAIEVEVVVGVVSGAVEKAAKVAHEVAVVDADGK
jgi:siroheme synthase